MILYSIFRSLDFLLQKHFNEPTKIRQVHALLLTSGFFSGERTAFPYNCLMQAHLHLQVGTRTPLRLFVDMLSRGTRPNRHTFPSLLKSVVSLPTSAALHAQCLRRGLSADDFVSCSLIKLYSGFGAISDARQLFEEIPLPDLASSNAMLAALSSDDKMDAACLFFTKMCRKDVISWTTIINGLSRNGLPQNAVVLFRRLVCDNTAGKLGEATLVSALSACANLATADGLDAGREIHGYIFRYDCKMTAFLGTALVDMYGKHGRLDHCSNAFLLVKEKMVCTWNAFLLALACNGKEAEALTAVDQMRSQSLLPNQITFVAVLTACARAGLVESGIDWFRSMVADYRITPTVEHYGCLVHLLSRAKCLQEAAELIRRQPAAVDLSVCSALVSGCELHSDVQLGSEFGKLLISLQPQNSGQYIILRNIYAREGRVDDAAKVKELMEETRTRKLAGQSWLGSYPW